MVRFGAPRRESHRGLGDDDERHFPMPMAAARFAQRDTRRHIASQHCLPIPLHCLCAAPLVDPVVGGALTGSGSASLLSAHAAMESVFTMKSVGRGQLPLSGNPIAARANTLSVKRRRQVVFWPR